MNKPSYILGISESHNATAALLKNGEIIACASEERFTRIKNHPGIPKKAIEFCLKKAEIKADSLAMVTVADLHMGVNLGTDFAKNLHVETKPIDKLFFFFLSHFERLTEQLFPQIRDTLYKTYKNILILKNRNSRRTRTAKLRQFLKISKEKFTFVDHHTCHAAAPLFSSGFIDSHNKILIFTADGTGDFKSATVSIYEKGEIKLLQEVNSQNSLGFFFFHITQFLGFKPIEDEYKIMGLAPYAQYSKFKNIYKSIKNLIKLDSQKQTWRFKFDEVIIKEMMPKLFKFKRFDYVAASAQKILEDTLTFWVSKNVQKYSCNTVVCGGGVFANVKVNQKIASLPHIKESFFMPSPGDESNAIGTAYYTYFTQTKSQPAALSSLYLGASYTEGDIENILKIENSKFEITKPKNINVKVAKLLANNEVVARFVGPMEFGARALGNRSILASPKDKTVVDFINVAIKNRDFWMPFAPTILSERSKDYLVTHSSVSTFMNVAYNSTPLAQKDLAAATHPRDKTTRPQILEKSQNPAYYNLIREFEKITSIGALINTSFNLHGEPIVCTPEDAIKTFLNSGLKYLQLEAYLLIKK